MEKFKNSSYIAFYAATVTSIVGFVVFAIFVYPKNPLAMPDTMIGLLTITPFVVFFVVTLLTVPIIVIPIKKQNALKNKHSLKGIYEILLYVLFCTLVVVLFDFIYQFTIANEFSEKFALALKSALAASKDTFSELDYDSFSKLPFLVQNMLPFIMGIATAAIIAYPISIAIANRLTKKINHYGKY